MDDLSNNQGHALEQKFVRQTYDNIADDFSSTRYKKWPKVDKFLTSLRPSSLLLDVGCGNGKYLDNKGSFNIGCDLSLNLLTICKKRGFEVVLCDMSRLPFRPESFDAIICIAALHHVISAKRRQTCLEGIVNLMSPAQSQFLIQVWSFEQNLELNNPYLKRNLIADSTESKKCMTICDDIQLPIHKNRTLFPDQDVLVPFNTRKCESTQIDASGSNVSAASQLRYYHVFKENELDSMLNEIDGIVIQETYYDKGNWCCVVNKVSDEGTRLDR